MRKLDQKELEAGFVGEVAREEGGEAILKCYTCGTCTAICPVAMLDDRFSPRSIIHMAVLGMRDEALSSDFIWLCSACYSCHERCPQGIRVTDIMRAMTRIACREGKVHRKVAGALDLLEKDGRLAEVTDFEQKMRAKKDLEELDTERVREEVRRLFQATNVRKRIRKEGGGADG